MRPAIKVAASADGIWVFKEHREWRRSLSVCLRSVDGRLEQVLDFPPDQDVLEIHDAGPGATCDLLVRHRSPLRRLTGGSHHDLAELRDKPLRVLITGSGRSGTQTVASFLDGATFEDGTPVSARHEPLSEFLVPALTDGRTDLVRAIQLGLDHNVESAPYYSLYPDAAMADRIVHVVRDGRRVVQSGLNRGWYQNDSIWNRLKPDLPGDTFTRCCHLWRISTENAMRLAGRTFRLEDLAADADARTDFCLHIGVVPDGRDLPHANRGARGSGIADWSDARRETFTGIAGPLMDWFYPGWNIDW
jgi:hypothetical protein